MNNNNRGKPCSEEKLAKGSIEGGDRQTSGMGTTYATMAEHFTQPGKVSSGNSTQTTEGQKTKTIMISIDPRQNRHLWETSVMEPSAPLDASWGPVLDKPSFLQLSVNGPSTSVTLSPGCTITLNQRWVLGGWLDNNRDQPGGAGGSTKETGPAREEAAKNTSMDNAGRTD